MAARDLISRPGRKSSRFRRAEFQNKLKEARHFKRRTAPKITAEKKEKSRFRSFLSFLFVAVIMGASAYYLFFSDALLLRKAKVSAGGFERSEVERVLSQMEEERIYGIVRANHFLALTRESFLQNFRRDFPGAKRINVFRREFPDTLEIAIEERFPKYVWESAGQYFLVDQDRIAFERIQDYDPAQFEQLLLRDTSGSEVSIGKELGSHRLAEFADALSAHWNEMISETQIESISFAGRESADLAVHTQIGFRVWFDRSRQPLAQMQNLRLLLDAEINLQTLGGLSYIDLRLPEVAYYCYVDAPCALEYVAATTTEATIPNP